MRIIYFVAIIILIPNYKVIAQNQNDKVETYSGVFLEYNTFLITHNLKLFTDLNYYANEKLVASLQPGIELIYSFPGAERTFYPGSPYYDINLLGAIQLFPNYGISIKPFMGISYTMRTQNYKNDSSFLDIKYGSTLQLNISDQFKIIGKIMNVPKYYSEQVSIFLGVGIAFKIF